MTVPPPHPSTVAPVRSRTRRLSRDLIAAGVVEVGFEGLTTTKLARHLGVTHGALYRHVGNREQLVHLGVDRLIAAIDWGPAGVGWRALTAGRAWRLWALLEEHPGLAQEMSALESAPSAAKRVQFDTATQLIGLGFTEDGAFLAADLVHDLVFDVHIRTAVILSVHGDDVDVTGSEWFSKKLEVVLDGIGVALAPRRPRRPRRPDAPA